MLHAGFEAGLQSDSSARPLLVRRRSCAVSNHEATLLILRDAAKMPLLRMRGAVERF
jgi:hypothetical protein